MCSQVSWLCLGGIVPSTRITLARPVLQCSALCLCYCVCWCCFAPHSKNTAAAVRHLALVSAAACSTHIIVSKFGSGEEPSITPKAETCRMGHLNHFPGDEICGVRHGVRQAVDAVIDRSKMTSKCIHLKQTRQARQRSSAHCNTPTQRPAGGLACKEQATKPKHTPSATGLLHPARPVHQP